MNKYLIVGLGNIGNEYVDTRHNIGFDVVDAFVKKNNGSFFVDRLAAVSEIKLKGRSVLCIKPSTYMNLSGKSMQYWLQKEKISVENSLTIVDDLALPLNKLRVRAGGSDAGHNGLKNIQAVLGTTEYPRLRFGIGNNYSKGQQIDFVLGKWNDEEMPVVQKKINACAILIEQFIFEGVPKMMNEANRLEF